VNQITNEFKSKIDNILKVIKKKEKAGEVPVEPDVIQKARESPSASEAAELEAQQQLGLETTESDKFRSILKNRKVFKRFTDE
jgi:hypothetical protein